MNPLIDIGVNLTSKRFSNDLDQVLVRARTAGVIHQVITGTSVDGSQAAAELARRYPGELTATAGMHPHNAKELDTNSIPALRSLATGNRNTVVAIGECGLDYDRDFSPRAVQRRCFAQQLELAAELRLPVFLHERAAHDDFTAILREHRASLPNAVVHCFTGGRSELEHYRDLDCHIGITGWIADERRGQDLRDAAPHIATGRLMLETDAPYLTPKGAPGNAGRRNEPAFLPLVLDAVAHVMGRPATDIAAETTATARHFFGLECLA